VHVVGTADQSQLGERLLGRYIRLDPPTGLSTPAAPRFKVVWESRFWLW
jgi:hypothetical protein